MMVHQLIVTLVTQTDLQGCETEFTGNERVSMEAKLNEPSDKPSSDVDHDWSSKYVITSVNISHTQ